MVAIDGAWTLQSKDTAVIGRYHDLAFLGTSTSTLTNTARSGVLASTSSSGTVLDLQVLQRGAGANMSVDVNAGAGVISRSGQGPYLAISSATVNVAISTADPTNPRIDVVIMRVYDGVLSDGSTQATIEVVNGTPAASPVAPSLPTNAGGGTVCIALAQVRVDAGVSSIVTAKITDVRQSAGLRGATRPMLPGDNATSTTPVARIDGETRYIINAGGATGYLQTWVAAAWRDVWLSPSLGYAKYVATAARSYTANNTSFKMEFDSGTSTTPDISAAVGSGYSGLTDFTFNRAGVWDIKFHLALGFVNPEPVGWITLNFNNTALTTLYRSAGWKLLDGSTGVGGEALVQISMTESFNVNDTLSCVFSKHDAATATHTTDVSSPGLNCVTFRWVGPK